MPVLHPAELWQQSGRWDAIGDEMFRLKDRYQRDLCLGMTHEEVIAWMAAHEVHSYRDLPQLWYQIQTKERDEARPKSGVLRTREFVMKDSYSLDRDMAGLDAQYEAHRQAYCKIFDRCGLRYIVVESDPGMMGGAGSHEFMAQSPAGEDQVALCGSCGYAANLELALSRPPAPPFPRLRRDWRRCPRPTPGPSPRSPRSSRSSRPSPSSRWWWWARTARPWPWCAGISSCASENWSGCWGPSGRPTGTRSATRLAWRRASWDRWASDPHHRG